MLSCGDYTALQKPVTHILRQAMCKKAYTMSVHDDGKWVVDKSVTSREVHVY